MTNNSLYSLPLSRQISGPSVLSAATGNTLSTTDIHSTKSMRTLLQNRIVAVRANVDVDMRKFHSQRKLDYNRRVREIPSLTLGAYVFIINPILQTVSDASVEAMAKHAYSKLQARNCRPYQIISAQKKTIKIDDNGNSQTVSIGQVAGAPSSFLRQLDQMKIDQTNVY